MLPLRVGVVGDRGAAKRVLPAPCSSAAPVAASACRRFDAGDAAAGARGGSRGLRLAPPSGPLRLRRSVARAATMGGERSGLSSGEEVFEPTSEAEREANERRRQEAAELRAQQQQQQNGAQVGHDEDDDDEADPFVGLDDWRWSLNWNRITDAIFVGACPRRPKDVDTIHAKTGCTAVLCLQSHTCFEALGIDHAAIRARGGDIGVKVIHVPIRDFDHGSQAEMIPEAVRILNALLKTGHSVYVPHHH